MLVHHGPSIYDAFATLVLRIYTLLHFFCRDEGSWYIFDVGHSRTKSERPNRDRTAQNNSANVARTRCQRLPRKLCVEFVKTKQVHLEFDFPAALARWCDEEGE